MSGDGKCLLNFQRTHVKLTDKLQTTFITRFAIALQKLHVICRSADVRVVYEQTTTISNLAHEMQIKISRTFEHAHVRRVFKNYIPTEKPRSFPNLLPNTCGRWGNKYKFYREI